MKKSQTGLIHDKLISAKCRELVKGYFDVFDDIATDIVDELSTTIQSDRSEGIALEYIRREGMKQGIKEFLRRINSKASKTYEKE